MMAILSSKYLLLKELPKFTPDLGHASMNIFYNYRYFLLTLFAAHALSRLMPVLVMCFYDYVTDPDGSKSKPVASRKPGVAELAVAIITVGIPFAFLHYLFLLAIIPVLYVAFALARYFKKWIGGYTGDCLGAIQQVSELTFYLAMIIIWRFIV
jgi:adenosylcobinamide-GDP ribazoletransferase